MNFIQCFLVRDLDLKSVKCISLGLTILIKAAKYYKLAAAENHTQAMYNLALMYREGEGVKQDTGKAIDLMERAAEQGLAQV